MNLGDVEILILALLLGLIPAVIAHRKGGNFFLWWLYGASVFIVALPSASLKKANTKAIESRKVESGDSRTCPSGAEIIKCNACDAQIPDLAKFCGKCGAPQIPAESQPKVPEANAHQSGVKPLPEGSPAGVGETKLKGNLDGNDSSHPSVAKATRKGGLLRLPLLILGGLGVVVILIFIVRAAERSPQAASSTTLAQPSTVAIAQPSTEPRANAPTVAIAQTSTEPPANAALYDHLQFVKGTCNASSHTSEGPLGADLTKQQSRFFCDTAVITFFDNHQSHVMINFLEKQANHAPTLGFAGQVENDGIMMPVDHVYLEPEKATPVSEGVCKFFFEDQDRHMKGIVCVIKADEGGRRTVAAVEFRAEPGQ